VGKLQLCQENYDPPSKLQHSTNELVDPYLPGKIAPMMFCMDQKTGVALVQQKTINQVFHC